jgi:pimeloyl-ACP methyl ester carboxylesterase
MIKRALERLGVSHAIVLGNSWGASVAVALALKFPDLVRGLVLASGYYYPTLRPDVVALSAPAVPVVGDVLGSPIKSRMLWPLMMAEIFRSASMPAKFEGFPKEMAVLSFSDSDIGCGIGAYDSGRFHFRNQYASLKMPVVIIAGDEDRLINIDKQSARLHSDVSQSTFHRIPGTGHMIHQTATGEVMSAINEVASDRAQPN